MNKLISCIFALSLFIASCDNTKETNKEEAKNDYEKTKETLAEKEAKDPVMFLKVTGSDKHNLIGQTVVKGKISNTAATTSFKDVEVQLEFYSKTGTKLETDRETVYEIIAPGETKSFKTKYFAPKGSDSVALSVLSAKVNK